MKLLLSIISLFLLVGCTSTSNAQTVNSFFNPLSYPSQIGYLENCQGEIAEKEVVFHSDSKEPIKIFGIRGIEDNFEIFHNNCLITSNDTLSTSFNDSFTDKKGLKLLVKLKIDTNATFRQRLPFFKTNSSNYLRGTAEFVPRSYFVSSQSISEGETVLIEKSKYCLDSVAIMFPYRGTISTVHVFDDETELLNSTQKKPIKSRSYYAGDKDNQLIFAESEVGEYHVNFMACHWGGSFKIKIE